MPITGLGLQLDVVAENTLGEMDWPNYSMMPTYHPNLFTPSSEDFPGFYANAWKDGGKYTSDQVFPFSDGYQCPSQPLSSSSSNLDSGNAWTSRVSGASRASNDDTSPQNSLPIYLQTPTSPVHHFGDGVWGFARPSANEWEAGKWSPQIYQEG